MFNSPVAFNTKKTRFGLFIEGLFKDPESVLKIVASGGLLEHYNGLT